MGKLAATVDFWSAWHVLVWRNIRFYLNPVTMKLEPIAYDANHENNDKTEAGDLVSTKLPFFSDLLQDSEIFQYYKKTILKLAKQINSENWLEALKEKEKGLLKHLHHEYYFLPEMETDFLSSRQTL